MLERALQAVKLLTQIREDDPALFEQIRFFVVARQTQCVNENYECANCFLVGPLDQHGRCARCGSAAVISAVH